ncbi:Glucosidase YgjK [termite gut metagenome]|uniref:Glucosidase YgjK n=1 Tax=termite gut metagenome TaxID=433724 RepID=A0A5J4RKS4_9ZZZZ
MRKIFILFLFISAIAFRVFGQTPVEKYNQMQRKLATGWNTWDTRSVLTHVLLPYGAAVDLNFLDSDNQRVTVFQIGARGNEVPVMHPGPHTYDGTYTDISIEWKGHKLRVQSAAEGLKNVILITPLDGNREGGRLIVAPKELWYRWNNIKVESNHFSIEPGGADFKIQAVVHGDFIEEKNREIFVAADKPVVICCNGDLSFPEAEKFIQSHADAFVKVNRERFKDYYEVYNAMQSVLSWDNIYDPTIRKVITPVSRIWNVGWSVNPLWGGFVLFCWDTYFASMMLATGNKELAYANVVEITNAITEDGFVPNFYVVNDYKSRDRSQPPVGSLAVWNIYQKYKEKWLLELVYNNLLTWNRWWDENRNIDGLLCWGSTPYEKVTYRSFESVGVNATLGGAYESGLDNSHMYDNILFDEEKHLQLLNDAGLSGLYVMDCDLLAKIAGELGKRADVKELRKRGEQYRKNLAKLWDEEQGLYYNRHTDTKILNRRISPTNFYPLLANVPTQKQAKRMITEHLLNPEEFWGEWVIPTTPRNDPAFKDNNYWRGRIWAPLNFLVYMGLRNYDLPEARKALSEKSKNLLLKSWLKDGYVFENYNANTGDGDDVGSSDKFYHWGALLGFITLIEEGYFDTSR